MALGAFFSLLAVIFGLAYFWIQRKMSFFARKRIVHETPSLPFGNMHGRDHPALIFKSFYDKFKSKAPVFGLHIFISPAYVASDLDFIKNMLIRDFDIFYNRGFYSNKRDDPLTGHLLFLEGEEWKYMRNKLSPTFTSGKMKTMFHTLLKVSNHMIDKLKSQETLESVEVKEVLASYSTDVIGNVAFGLEMNAIDDPNSEFRQVGKTLFANNRVQLIKFSVYASFKKLARALHLKLVPSEITDFFLKVVTDTKNYRIANNIERHDVFDSLIKMDGLGSDGKLTIGEVAAQSFVFFIAGFETSSSTATFALYHLVKNPEIQEKLRTEIKSVMAKHGNEITYDAMQEMVYLQMVIDETLRMSPPVSQLAREPLRDYQIPNSDIVIPKNSQVLVPVYSIHMDPDIYPEPEKFIPERFSEENKAKRHPMAYIPFGEGPKRCIGLRFGLMQTKIALIQLLTNFKILPSERTPKTLEYEVGSPFLASKTGIFAKFENL